MTEKPKLELEVIEGDDSLDDVIVPVNISKLIDLLIAKEEAERAAKRQNADKLFLDTLRKETFGGE